VQIASRPALDGYAELARMTGGALAEAGDGDADWRRLYDDGIAVLPGEVPAAGKVRAWRTLHAWPLLLSLLLFMFAWLPRAAPSAALLLALMLSPGQDAYASEDVAQAERAAWQAYRAGNFNDAIRFYGKAGAYAGQMGAGAASWKLNDYAASARYFGAALLLGRSDSERADALYNLGNAHFALARWQTAAEAYRAVLQARPDDERAQRNLAEAERQLAKRKREPFKTDLRGRRGSIAEGETNVDWDKELAMPEFEPLEDTTLVEQDAGVEGARLQGSQIAGASASLDARRLQSGLRKLERLQERPRTLLKGMLKQDGGAAQDRELAPW
jgi:Ca-activated chloride channel family protein